MSEQPLEQEGPEQEPEELQEPPPRRADAERRCVACRRREGRAALLRFVCAPSHGLLFDLRKKAPGRGLHVCARRACLEQALKAAFRKAVQGGKLPQLEQLIEEMVLPALWKRYRELLVNARRCNQLVMGSEMVEKHAASELLVAYMLATDASAGTRSKYASNAERKGLPVVGLLPRGELSAAIGKDNAVVLGWLDRNLFEAFERLEQQILELGSGPLKGPEDRSARGKGL